LTASLLLDVTGLYFLVCSSTIKYNVTWHPLAPSLLSRNLLFCVWCTAARHRHCPLSLTGNRSSRTSLTGNRSSRASPPHGQKSVPLWNPNNLVARWYGGGRDRLVPLTYRTALMDGYNKSCHRESSINQTIKNLLVA